MKYVVQIVNKERRSLKNYYYYYYYIKVKAKNYMFQAIKINNYQMNKTNDLILNLTPENVTQHSRIE